MLVEAIEGTDDYVMNDVAVYTMLLYIVSLKLC